MSKIEIFEAAGCCATSSVVVSDEAVKWNASAEWAKKNDVDIQRYSLAKNPQQFLNCKRRLSTVWSRIQDPVT
ncbi:arsenical resistance operon trans-acting repressor ArsD family protein [Escherichia coli 2-210-07_S1_C2]|nr:arsenical resistance operon trans-acting repressor ArsD family protein [Escherichia coli 2-210-07_S1_C3]KDW88299.1 arsenical resistance operon trans-acting repressor ArsD family protein [Escherichia coli 2-210-07_S1_C2]